MHCFYLVLLVIATCEGVHRISLKLLTKKAGTAFMEDVSNQYYMVPAVIGNQEFDLLVDTGSANTWVVSVNCSSEDCSSLKKYDSKNSSTYQGTYNKSKFYLEYADGSTGKGYFSIDSVTIAGLTVRSQYFGEVVSDNGNGTFDGVFGLGPDSQVAPAGSFQPLTFLSNLKKDGVIKNRIFSLRLTGDDSSVLTIGEVDDSLYTGKLIYASVLANYSSWTILVDSMNSGNTTIGTNINTVVDSGTTAIALPASFSDLFEDIPTLQEIDGGLVVRCSEISQLPNLNFTISGVEFNLQPEDYILHIEDSYCQLLIMLLKDVIMILGDNFFRKVLNSFS
ncbi:hypothetical protein L9F63_014192 [Diploptera punctata]|uniref:Peptidase A1 domain-containing protein n=1 Tax=Diploptera punctata TaxID=6984 RepID=A0AAD8ELX8_DIPPU|nr:hypothetical protein L9F63_014192 [Diploptera punctata]